MGTPPRTTLQLSVGTLRLPRASFSQNRAMSRSFAHLSVATAQGQTQLVLQHVKVSKFPLYVRELFFQSAPHRRTRLQAASPQIKRPRISLSLNPRPCTRRIN